MQHALKHPIYVERESALHRREKILLKVLLWRALRKSLRSSAGLLLKSLRVFFSALSITLSEPERTSGGRGGMPRIQ